MKKTVFLMVLCLLSIIGCQSAKPLDSERKLTKRLEPLHFSISEFVEGDFDGDGLKDVAAIINCQDCKVINDHVLTKRTWFDHKEESIARYALVIALNIASSTGETVVLYSEVDRFTSPSFQLLCETWSDVSVQQTKPVSDGDVLVLPTEAGIDEQAYFVDGKVYVLSPEESP